MNREVHVRFRERLRGKFPWATRPPVAQLDPGNGKTRKAYLWAYRSNDLAGEGPRMIVFDYQQGRSGEHARQFLGTWTGHLMVDDYVGYKALFSKEGKAHLCIELACLAHARRKFFDDPQGCGKCRKCRSIFLPYQANQSPMALQALQHIAALYAIEAEGKALTIDARQLLRAEKSLPQLQVFHNGLLQTRATIAQGGASANALDYTLKRWPALIRYAETGYLPIDNNPLENSIRPIAIGKKNGLFAGSERAGQRAAAIQTLLGTAKLNGLNPADWLKETLEKLPTWPNSRIDELLPLAPQHIEAIKQKLPVKAKW